MAVASDILRWLKPVYELGIYSDFDVNVDTRTLPKDIVVEKPLLFSLGSCTIGDFEGIIPNTHTIAVADSQAALSDIQKIQKIIYDRCSTQPSNQRNFIDRYIYKQAFTVGFNSSFHS